MEILLYVVLRVALFAPLRRHCVSRDSALKRDLDACRTDAHYRPSGTRDGGVTDGSTSSRSQLPQRAPCPWRTGKSSGGTVSRRLRPHRWHSVSIVIPTMRSAVAVMSPPRALP